MGKTGRPTPLSKADEVATRMHLTVGDLLTVDQLLTCGSVRRRVEKVSDVDMLVVPYPGLDSLEIVTRGIEGMHATEKQGWMEVDGVRVEFWLCPPDATGPMMAFLTGPADLNVAMRQQAKLFGLKLSQYGVFGPDGRVDVDELSPYDSEKNVFSAVGVKYLEPVERSTWRGRHVLLSHEEQPIAGVTETTHDPDSDRPRHDRSQSAVRGDDDATDGASADSDPAVSAGSPEGSGDDDGGDDDSQESAP